MDMLSKIPHFRKRSYAGFWPEIFMSDHDPFVFNNRYYCLSILDKHHHPDITLHQGIKILTMCTDELKRRLPIDFKGMVVKAVTKDGIRDIEFDDDKIVKSA